MTPEQFKTLANQIEQVARYPEKLQGVLDKLKELKSEELNEQYIRTNGAKERLAEIAVEALHGACQVRVSDEKNKPEENVFAVIKCLVDRGINPELKNSVGRPLLHIAFIRSQDKFVIPRYYKVLVDFFDLFQFKDIDVNCKNSLGETLPIHAVKTGHYAFVEFLHAEFGCELNIADKGYNAKKGQTVADHLDKIVKQHNPDPYAESAYDYVKNMKDKEPQRRSAPQASVELAPIAAGDTRRPIRSEDLAVFRAMKQIFVPFETPIIVRPIPGSESTLEEETDYRNPVQMALPMSMQEAPTSLLPMTMFTPPRPVVAQEIKTSSMLIQVKTACHMGKVDKFLQYAASCKAADWISIFKELNAAKNEKIRNNFLAYAGQYKSTAKEKNQPLPEYPQELDTLLDSAPAVKTLSGRR